jgi:hypothetical protein
MRIKAGLAYRSLTVLAAGAVLWALCLANNAGAQGTYRSSGLNGTIDAGTTITARTNETISANNSDGRVFSGVVDQDVLDRNGSSVIPRGSSVELIVRKLANNQVALDLDSVTINGQRYGVQTEGNVISSQQREGLGANKRTGEFVGGGALLGAIIGAVAGGGKGAAIGAGAGAAAGAGTQVLTRGKNVNVPAESLLTFRLAQPLRAGIVDNGYTRNGVHYHPGSGNAPPQSAAYREGLRDGRSDADRNLPRNMQTYRWTGAQDRSDYEAGYNDGYQYQGAYNTSRQKPGGYYNNGTGSISIGADKNISWQGPDSSSVYVQVDNESPKPFATGQSGVQEAPWITQGHLYVFILKDANGNEIARDQQDLRTSYRTRQR